MSESAPDGWPFDRAAETLRRELSAVEANEQRLRTILEHAPVMLDSFDREGRCQLWNQECERRLGWSREEIRQSETPLELLYPDPSERARARRWIERADGKFRRYHVRARDGSVRVQWWADFRLESGEQISCGYDVTEQDAALERLRRSESRYRALVDALPDSVLRVRRDGTCLDLAAGAGLEVLGLGPAAVGEKVQDLLPPRLARRGAAAVERVLRSGGAVTRSFEVGPARQGGHRHFEARFVSSGVDEVVAIVRDVTEREAIEERLRRSQKLEALGELAGGLAHDFNNLLTVILGNVELLRSALADPGAEVAELLEGIGKAARGGSRRIRKLLAFSRGRELERVPVRLGDRVRGAIGTLERLLPGSIEVQLQVPEDGGPEVLAEPDALDQMVLNLATNARDAMPTGGTLSLRVFHGVRGSDRTACLQVADTGAGIPNSSRARVFDPFFTTKPLEHGSGLGLAIVHGLVRRHYGWIELESEVGRGTTVSIYLPLQAATRSSRRATGREPAESSHGSLSLLVVDDEEGVRRVARHALAAGGYRVLEAADGQEALEVLARHPEVLLVVSDLVMPRLGGAELLLRAQEREPGLRFLFTTGYSDRAAELVGGAPVLLKPWTPDALLERVRELLGEAAD